jgi:hypothetical protein
MEAGAMAKTARKTDPELWEEVKREVTAGDKGGREGQWSARKAQLATQAYQSRGGGYEGETSKDNSLQEWQDEDWGTKSGRKSTETGERYLPKAAREELSDEEYRRTTEKKRRDTEKGRQFSGQPDDIRRKTTRHRDGGETKADLYEEARRRGIQGRSTMTKAELAEALAR